MKNMNIKTSQGTKIQFKFPENLSEAKLNNKVAFDVWHERIAVWMKEQVEQETFEENKTYYLFLLSQAIAEFLDLDLTEVLKFDISDVTDSKGDVLPYVLANHFHQLSNGPELDLDSVEQTLIGLYNNIVALLDSYKFEYKDATNFQFVFEGETYEIPYVVKKLFTGKKIFSEMSVQQGVEIMNIKKFLSDKVSVEKMDTERVKSLRFSSFLRMFAITVKKPDEELPLDDTEFQDLMEERMILFKDIDVQTANDVTFFLITTILN